MRWHSLLGLLAVLACTLSAAAGHAATVAVAGAEASRAGAVGTRPAAAPPYRLSKAPGLARAVDPDGTTHVPHNRAAVPSTAGCVSAWNAYAPKTTRAWLARFAPRPANIRVGTHGRWRFCYLEISLDGNRMVSAYLYEPHTWKGIVVSPPISGFSQSRGSLLRDGRIRGG